MPRYDFDRLDTENICIESGRWDMANYPVRGKEHYYNIRDRNYRPSREWQFVVRVPDGRCRDQSIQVQPWTVPGDAVWDGLERRVITFIPAENGPHYGSVYCKIFFQDTYGVKTKIGTHRGERNDFPCWMQPLRYRMRLKKTVKDTRGTDAKSQVIVLKPEDHKRMVWVFFATKVWVAAEGFRLRR